MATRVVHIEVHHLAHGLWCDHCLLPSRYRMALVNPRTLHRYTTLTACDDCGQQERE